MEHVVEVEAEVEAEVEHEAEEMAMPEGITIILPDGSILSGFETIIVRR
jgi:hypothetical protein